ncbi:hypothetical protein [Rathayibacter tanaceti]|uniref:Uncharacterized protein n=2 Tax=Rathayibacter tanaceti TaxID=1671680 RepID=A0A166I595_9MICO|nr:hypothetical protein [Rathayibacter tanaceti]KZX21645.1 hypothetical protein ACH61_01247 [Rathayibacter tanaceti]QHC56505.1 hypothetical protein GSU10_13280 [Rathayibacter tanaceti]TCO36714.1 hypothetical protein EV639_106117 [Rathayibacter tanaceti]
MIRTIMTLHDRALGLEEGVDVAGVKTSIETTLRSGGGFVELVVVGNRAVSVLISAGTLLLIDQEDVAEDDRDARGAGVSFEEMVIAVDSL